MPRSTYSYSAVIDAFGKHHGPEEAAKWFNFWSQARLEWWKAQGLSADSLILRRHEQDELAHYAKEGEGTYDVEFRYPFSGDGHGELEGIAHRSNFDLSRHQEFSKTKLEYFDPETRARFVPHVIEPAAGLTRGVLALLCDAYDIDPSRPSPELMRFKPHLAPIKLGIFPLTKKNGLPDIAEKLFMDLRGKYMCQYDIKQSIGKRYARMDEAGTPFCVTIDHTTLEDQTVTLRHRDTGAQDRIALDQVGRFLGDALA